MKEILLALLILGASSEALGQVNVEDMRGKRKENLSKGDVPIFVRIDLGLDYRSGNNDVLATSFGFRYDVWADNHHAFLQTNYDHGSSNGEEFKDEAFAHLRWTNMFGGWYGSDLFIQSQYDAFKDLSLRQLEGGYVRFEGALGHRGLGSFGLGAMSEYENLKSGEGDGFAFRGTSYLSYSKSGGKLPEQGMALNLTAYFQPKILNPSDFRVFVVAQAELKWLDWVSLVPMIRYAYDSHPPNGVESSDLQTKLFLRLGAW